MILMFNIDFVISLIQIGTALVVLGSQTLVALCNRRDGLYLTFGVALVSVIAYYVKCMERYTHFRAIHSSTNLMYFQEIAALVKMHIWQHKILA